MTKILLFILVNLLIINFVFSQAGVSINTDGSLADSSAILDVSAKGRGILIPRMSTNERPVKPVESLMIYNTSTQCFEAYNAKNAQWVSIACLGCQIPGFFSLLDATDITLTSFTANWTASSWASTYYIDVATDAAFTQLVAGYSNLNLGNVLTKNIADLSCNTNYYYRVRGDNGCGTGVFSDNMSITTGTCTTDYCSLTSQCSGDITDARDGKLYSTVQIGNQCWMKANLNYGTYVPIATSQAGAGTQKYCYGDVAANCITYGGLYEWAEMMNGAASVNTNGPGPQGICPSGWHIPTDNEWKCLEMNLGMTAEQTDSTTWRGTNEGGKLKKPGLWQINIGATNSSGFSALPAGSALSTSSPGEFWSMEYGTDFWSASENSNDTSQTWYRELLADRSDIARSSFDKSLLLGFSVRCIKDN